MFLIRTATFIIQMPCSTTTIFVSLNIRFVNSKSLLKLKSLPNILLSTVGTCYQMDDTATITRQITFNEVCLTCYCIICLTCYCIICNTGQHNFSVRLKNHLYQLILGRSFQKCQPFFPSTSGFVCTNFIKFTNFYSKCPNFKRFR